MIRLRRLSRRLLLAVLPTGPHDDLDAQGRDQGYRAGFAEGVNVGRAGAGHREEKRGG